jgi:hypothetical protein
MEAVVRLPNSGSNIPFLPLGAPKNEAMQFDAVAKLRQPKQASEKRCNAGLMQADAVDAVFK